MASKLKYSTNPAGAARYRVMQARRKYAYETARVDNFVALLKYASHIASA